MKQTLKDRIVEYYGNKARDIILFAEDSEPIITLDTNQEIGDIELGFILDDDYLGEAIVEIIEHELNNEKDLEIDITTYEKYSYEVKFYNSDEDKTYIYVVSSGETQDWVDNS